MAAAPSLADLQKQNEMLKAELAKLEQLVRETSEEAHDIERNQSKLKSMITNRKDVEDAFRKFDTNHNNSIDKSELKFLAASLGEVLDEEELESAFKAIDTSHDGNITFNEFYRWWTAEDRVRTDKGTAKLTLLQARLASSYAARSMPQLIRALSETKLDKEDDESQWCNHHVLLSVGMTPNTPVQSSLHAKLLFNEEPKKDWYDKLPGCGSYFALKLTKKAGSDVGKARSALLDIVSKAPKNHERHESFVEATADDNTVLVIGIKEADPLQSAKQLNLDFQKFIRDASLKLDFGCKAGDFIDVRNVNTYSLASLIKARFEVSVKFRKEFIYNLSKLMDKLRNAMFVSLVEKTNFSIVLGEVEAMVKAFAKFQQGIDPVEEIKRVQEIQNQQLAMMGINDPNVLHQLKQQQELQVQQAMQMRGRGIANPTADMLLTKDFQTKFNNFYTDAIKQITRNESAAGLVKVLKENYDQLESIHVSFASGFGVDIKLQDLILFDLLPAQDA